MNQIIRNIFFSTNTKIQMRMFLLIAYTTTKHIKILTKVNKSVFFSQISIKIEADVEKF